MGNNPSEFKGPKNPVEIVSWDDCQRFLEKLNGNCPHLGGGEFRLPTEAQWEYACRAGSTGSIVSGTMSLCFAIMRGLGRTRTCGRIRLARRSRTPLGFSICTGTCMEWCADWYEGYYANSRRTFRRGLRRARPAFQARGGYYHPRRQLLPFGGPRRLQARARVRRPGLPRLPSSGGGTRGQAG